MRSDIDWRKVADEKPNYFQSCLVWSGGLAGGFRVAWLARANDSYQDDFWQDANSFIAIPQPKFWAYTIDLVPVSD